VAAKQVTRRLKEVAPGAMPEVLRVATDLYARDQVKLAQAEERQRLVEATEEAGLPTRYLERAAGLVLARQRMRLQRRRCTAVLAAVGVALAVWGGRSLIDRAPISHLAPTAAVTAPAPSAPGPDAGARAAAPEAAPLEGSAWSVVDGGGAFGGITPVSVGDGVPLFVTRGGRRCLTTRPGTTPLSLYLYFDIDDARTRDVAGPVFVAVEYFDASPAMRLALQYDSATGEEPAARYQMAEERSGAHTFGSRSWRTAYFRLEQPRFSNGQNAETDFRLCLEGPPIEQARTGWPLFVRSLRLTRARPAEWVRDGG
jgi:hypothetical protein